MSEKSYHELALSDSLSDRLEYSKRLKEDIFMNERVTFLAEQNGVVNEELRAANKEMKDRLSNFDIYRQKPMYTCWRCKELECICDTL